MIILVVVKGIAEIAAIPSAAAVVSALTDAIGVEFNEILVTRRKVLPALQSPQAG